MMPKVNTATIILAISILYSATLHGRTDAAAQYRKASDPTLNTPCGGRYDVVPGVINHRATSGSDCGYSNNEICTWLISSSSPLAFYFSKFNTEEHYDHVTIRDGGSTGSPLIEKLSGKSLQNNFTTAGDAYITFESDANVVGTGFVLHWRYYSAEEQCRDKNGVCVHSGERCDGTFDLIKNSCDDRCACCVPDLGGAKNSLGASDSARGVEMGLKNTWTREIFTDGKRLTCYVDFIHYERRSWEDAKARCESRKMRLAVLYDLAAFLDYVRLWYGDTNFWLGASDSANEGEFVWLNGQALDNSFPWAPNQPDNSGKNHRDENCLQYSTRGGFNDAYCFDKMSYVCNACYTQDIFTTTAVTPTVTFTTTTAIATAITATAATTATTTATTHRLLGSRKLIF